jgi:polar amino acid transport system substrate-binding protein
LSLSGHGRAAAWLCGLLFGALLIASSPGAEGILIGAEDDWYPYTAVRDGQIVGMTADLVRSAFAASGTPVELVAYPYARCMQLVHQGALAGCFNTAPDAEVMRDYRLSDEPLFTGEILLWAPRDGAAPVTSLAALAGKRVATVNGYEYGPAFDSAAAVVRVPVRRDLNGFLMLLYGRVDYVIAYRGTSQALFDAHAELRDRFVPVATVHRPQLHVSFSPQNADAPLLRQRFDEGMRRLHASGRYDEILKTWHHDGQALAQSPATLQ